MRTKQDLGSNTRKGGGMPATNEHVWAFDLGKASLGEAVRVGTKFLHKHTQMIRGIKRGLRKPRVEVIVLPCGKRFGSSQPLTPPDWF